MKACKQCGGEFDPGDKPRRLFCKECAEDRDRTCARLYARKKKAQERLNRQKNKVVICKVCGAEMALKWGSSKKMCTPCREKKNTDLKNAYSRRVSALKKECLREAPCLKCGKPMLLRFPQHRKLCPECKHESDKKARRRYDARRRQDPEYVKKRNAESLERLRRCSNELDDVYVKQVLRQTTGLPREYIPQELIDLKRAQLKAERMTR